MIPLAPGHAQFTDVAESVFYLDQIYPADVCEPRKHEQHLECVVFLGLGEFFFP